MIVAGTGGDGDGFASKIEVFAAGGELVDGEVGSRRCGIHVACKNVFEDDVLSSHPAVDGDAVAEVALNVTSYIGVGTAVQVNGVIEAIRQRQGQIGVPGVFAVAGDAQIEVTIACHCQVHGGVGRISRQRSVDDDVGNAVVCGGRNLYRVVDKRVLTKALKEIDHA